jgi:SAM-dependent methyltransferase
MAKISELVKTREHLQAQYDTSPIAENIKALDIKLSAVGSEIEAPEFRNEITDLVHDLNRVNNNLKLNQDRFNYIIEQLNKRISIESQKFYNDNYSLELRVESEAVGNIRKVRVMDIAPDLEQEIINRLQFHTNWKYPTLEIGCRDGEWTRYLTAGDPLYVVDNYRDFIDSTVSRFEPEYQRRLRPFLTKEHDLTALPQLQFGFVFCWNFLNYRSLDTIKDYLRSIKDLLRPGGVFMFSYNNGDLHESAGYAEGHWMSYIPKSMLVPMCESLGFEILADRDHRGGGTTISWLEVKRPGTLQTVKAHQVLGEIKARTDIKII